MISLEKLCIDLIVQKFDQFYFAFTVSKDDKLKQNFEFLQRKFSAKLTDSLYTAKKLKKEYFKILINEHLNYLDLLWIEKTGFWCPGKDIFLHLPNLKSVKFSFCDDEILENVAKCCPEISEIHVSGWHIVTDTGVKYLYKNKNGVVPCPKLKKLFIGGNGVTDNCVKCLIRNLPYLERINCDNLPLLIHSLTEENLLEFKTVKSYNLVELHLTEQKFVNLPNYTHILNSCISVCPKLKYLSCYISDKEQLTWLSSLHLKELCLQFPSTGPEINIDSFLKQKVYNITSLSIYHCSMSISALGRHFPLLKELFAMSVCFSDDNDDDVELNFSCLSECTFLDIERSSHKAICFLLSSAPKLECLRLDESAFSPELKSQVLLWGKNGCGKTIRLFDINVASAKKFLEDILINCTCLKKFLVLCKSISDFDDPETMEVYTKLWKLAKSLPNKPKM